MHLLLEFKAWEASGLSQAAYCKAHELNAKTFGNWLRAKRRGNRHAIKSPAPIPVTVKSAAGLVASAEDERFAAMAGRIAVMFGLIDCAPDPSLTPTS